MFSGQKWLKIGIFGLKFRKPREYTWKLILERFLAREIRIQCQIFKTFPVPIFTPKYQFSGVLQRFKSDFEYGWKLLRIYDLRLKICYGSRILGSKFAMDFRFEAQNLLWISDLGLKICYGSPILGSNFAMDFRFEAQNLLWISDLRLEICYGFPNWGSKFAMDFRFEQISDLMLKICYGFPIFRASDFQKIVAI